MKVIKFIGEELGMFFLGSPVGIFFGFVGVIALFGFGFPALAGAFN